MIPVLEGKGATIVVADDDDDIRGLIKFTLERRGYTVVEATDGVEAVAEAHRVQPQLVLLDVMMPRLSGIEACRLLREDPMTKDIPIVFLSAKGQQAEIEQGLKSGAAGYLVKPFAPKDLAAYVGEKLRGGGK